VIVLDRPNPIGGALVEGPALDVGSTSFIGYFPAMPIRHGMTIGEIARLFNGERHINADLTVVSMKNWRRDEWFDETGQSWINPSPNMRTPRRCIRGLAHSNQRTSPSAAARTRRSSTWARRGSTASACRRR
jgi:uncharacterized protein YbbC (DUF1343 family)